MNLTRSLTLALALGLFSSALSATDTPDPVAVRERMRLNLPAVDKLKATGKIGENRRAYLEAREKLTEEEQRLIKTENADRKFIYQILADRANATLQSVEATRAAQIRQRSAPGLWLQDPAGRWYQKTDAQSDGQP